MKIVKRVAVENNIANSKYFDPLEGVCNMRKTQNFDPEILDNSIRYGIATLTTSIMKSKSPKNEQQINTIMEMLTNSIPDLSNDQALTDFFYSRSDDYENFASFVIENNIKIFELAIASKVFHESSSWNFPVMDAIKIGENAYLSESYFAILDAEYEGTLSNNFLSPLNKKVIEKPGFKVNRLNRLNLN